jgi:hypothetical protein
MDAKVEAAIKRYLRYKKTNPTHLEAIINGIWRDFERGYGFGQKEGREVRSSYLDFLDHLKGELADSDQLARLDEIYEGFKECSLKASKKYGSEKPLMCR